MSPGLHVKSDLTGRIVGILVFLFGVGLLGLVFNMAYVLFHMSPAEAMGIKFTGDAHKDPTAAVIGSQFGWIIVRVGCLCMMSIAGSLIAQSGIKLYFSAMKGHAPEVLTHHVTNAVPDPPQAIK